MTGRSYLSIGEVLSLLRKEFPDVTISKIRFLESQGLVNPERTPSGYRKFYDHDIERLGWVLRQQREHFLPLKIIKNRLECETNDLSGADCPAVIGEDGAEVIAGSPSTSIEWSPAADLPILVGQASGSMTGPTASTDAVRPGTALRELGTSGGSEPGSARSRQAPPTRRPAIFSGVGPIPVADASDAGGHDGASGSSGTQVLSGTRAAPVTRQAVGRTAAKAGSAKPEQATAGSAKSARGGVGDASRQGRSGTTSPTLGGFPTGSSMNMSADELAAASGLAAEVVTELQEFGLLGPSVVAGGVAYYDEEALAVAKLAIELAQFGIEPRHLRLYKNAVDREVSFIEQIVTPLLRQRNPDARLRAVETIDQMAQLGQALRSSLLRTAFRNQIGS